jgi:hypothetical protein
MTDHARDLCAVANCGLPAASKNLLCWGHWSAVDVGMRDACWSAFLALRPLAAQLNTNAARAARTAYERAAADALSNLAANGKAVPLWNTAEAVDPKELK